MAYESSRSMLYHYQWRHRIQTELAPNNNPRDNRFLGRAGGLLCSISRVHKRWSQHEGVSRRSALDMYLTYVANLSDYGVHWFDAKVLLLLLSRVFLHLWALTLYTHTERIFAKKRKVIDNIYIGLHPGHIINLVIVDLSCSWTGRGR